MLIVLHRVWYFNLSMSFFSNFEMPFADFQIFLQIDMEAPEFKDFAKEMVDYIAEYLENIRER